MSVLTEQKIPELKIPVDYRVIRLDEAAAIAGFSEATLRRRIDSGTGPRVIRLSARRVGIRLSDLKAWLEANASPAA